MRLSFAQTFSNMRCCADRCVARWVIGPEVIEESVFLRAKPWCLHRRAYVAWLALSVEAYGATLGNHAGSMRKGKCLLGPGGPPHPQPLSHVGARGAECFRLRSSLHEGGFGKGKPTHPGAPLSLRATPPTEGIFKINFKGQSS